IWDLGTYCINAARYLFRADPIEVFALRMDRRDDDRFAEVHEGMAVLLKFPGGRVAQFTVSFGSYEQDHYRLVGTKGHVELRGGRSLPTASIGRPCGNLTWSEWRRRRRSEGLGAAACWRRVPPAWVSDSTESI